MTIIDKAAGEGQRKLAKLELGLKFGSGEMIHEKLLELLFLGISYNIDRFSFWVIDYDVMEWKTGSVKEVVVVKLLALLLS